MHDWVCTEFPGLLFKFIPQGTLQIFGKDKNPIIHQYTIIHDGVDFFLETAPHLFNEPERMLMRFMPNHITLQGINKDENILHLTRLKLKAY